MAFHSIATAGMAIFDHRIESMLGGVEIDLVSAPIAPGSHRLEVDTTIGGIEIYLPKYVTFTTEGGALIGGHDVHDGLPWFSRVGRKIAGVFGVRPKIPDHAVVPSSDAPVAIHIKIDGGIGGVDIYRL